MEKQRTGDIGWGTAQTRETLRPGEGGSGNSQGKETRIEER